MIDERQHDSLSRTFTDPVGQLPDFERAPSEKPFGISILAGFSFLDAVGAGILFFSALDAEPWIPPGIIRDFLRSYFRDLTTAVLLLAPFLAIVSLAIGVGLSRTSSWAYPLTISWYGLIIALQIITGWNMALTLGGLIQCLISIAVLVYMLQPRIRELFRERPHL